MFQCPHAGCMFVHEKEHRVQEHVNEVHNLLRPFSCQTCGHAFKRAAHLRTHMITHTEREVFKCSHIGCFFKTFDNVKFEQHVVTHTSTESHAATFEAQLLAYFQPKYTCVGNKIDCTSIHDAYTYVLIDCVLVVGTTLVLLECDEKQHKDHTKYQVGNEVLRMKVATKALQSQHPGLSLLWVRFNPHGYTLNGRKQRPVLAARFRELHEFLDKYDGAHPVAVLYAGYDRVSVATGGWTVAVTHHPDYDASFAAKVLLLRFEEEDVSVATTVSTQTDGCDEAAHESLVPAESTQFPCTFCGASFVHRHHMQRHVREVHLKQSRTEKTMFACPREGCNQVYTQGHSSRTHIKAEHDGGGRVECSECHTWHSNQSNLQTHMRLKHGGQANTFCANTPRSK